MMFKSKLTQLHRQLKGSRDEDCPHCFSVWLAQRPAAVRFRVSDRDHRRRSGPSSRVASLAARERPSTWRPRPTGDVACIAGRKSSPKAVLNGGR